MNQRAVDLLVADMGKKTRGVLDGPRVHKADARVAGFALSYLDAFGWLRDELAAWKDISLQDIKLALGDLQASLGLKKTRTLTVQTVRAMEAPRCGCPDVLRVRHAARRKFADRAAARRELWRKSGLSYYICDHPAGVPGGQFSTAVWEAFATWTLFTGVRSERTRVRGDADVLVDVGRGPQSNFDGPGGTLAWVSVREDGDQLVMMLDADEDWTLHTCNRRVCVHNVLRHEAGHVLGLEHDSSPCALMSPFYNAIVDKPQPVDAAAASRLYG